MKVKAISIFLLGLLFATCNSNFKEVSEDNFIGLWELQGRSMFQGIQIKIERQNEKLTGKIVRLNDNKFVKMFADSNGVWISDIRRSSDFEFRITEKKLGKELFSLYGLSTSQEFKAQFVDDNTLALGAEGTDLQRAEIVYKRVKQ